MTIMLDDGTVVVFETDEPTIASLDPEMSEDICQYCGFSCENPLP